MKIIRINAMWCSGCLVMKKIWKEIEEEYPNLDIVTYDYDLDSDKINNYNIGTILPVVIFQKGENEKRLIGEVSKNEITSVIEEYYEI